VTSGVDEDYSFTYSGIDVAADLDSCDDTGVVVTWSAPTSWNDGGAGTRTYTVYRGVTDVSGALAEGTTSFVDTTGVNGTSYDYSVVGTNGYGCTSGGGTTIAATDVVGGVPTFAGVQLVNTMPGDVCGLSVEWNAATSNCGPSIVYNVYRSTTPGFTPDPATNLIAGCLADLYYEDTSVSGLTNYYYVVRAEDSASGHGGPCNDGFEDTNLVEVGGILTGGNESGTQLSDPLQVTSGSATSAFTPAFTYASAAAASVSYTLNHTGGAGGTLSYDYGSTPATIGKNAVTSFSQTVVESETVSSVSTTIEMTPPAKNGSNLQVDLVHASSGTTVTVYNALAINWTDGTFGPYSDFDGLSSASNWTVDISHSGGTGPSSNGTLNSWNLSIDYAGSGDPTTCTQVELVDPSAAATVLKAYNVADANPYDVTGLYTGAGTYQIRLSENCGSQAEITGAVMSVDEPACVAASASPVEHFTARSTGSNVKLEWQNPVAGYASTRICWDLAAFPVDPTTCTVLVDQIGIAGAYDTTTHSGLTNGSTYYYAAFVDNGSGEYSSRQTVMARPFDNSGKVNWAYHTSATALAPPGLYPGAAGSGASYGVSNDRVLHGMNSTAGGGDWPRTAPFDWVPMGMNGPAQSRPPIVPTTVVPGADLVAFLGSQDGHVYAADAKSGVTLWQSAANYGLVQGAPAGMFTAFGGAYDLLFAGSRVAGAGNSMYLLNPVDGSAVTSYGGTIGIISAGATVDYATNRLYFASRENPGVNENTLWCIEFDGSSATPVWSQAYGDIDSAPVLFDGVLYVGTNAGVVMAIDPATGAMKWRYATADGPVKGYVDYEFIFGAPRKVFFATTTSVWALTDNGASVTFEWQQSGVGGPSIPLTLADQGAMYVGSTDGRLYQLNPTTGGIVTSVVMGAGTATIGSPGYDWMNSLAYVGTEDGSVYAVTLPLQ
ncbi:MAG: PQQ-binding-like beta-propeller repeat protein, partial [Acidobacteriota bacterium]